uniref:Ethylene receptor isoform X2 n=1 Tax=Rhizophora mucronata TaxID=61149 RepID=A0A2P2MDM5_RHIMU
MLPSFENFTALPTMFNIVCIRRFSSPIAYSGKSGAKFNVICSFFTEAIGLIKLRTSPKIACRLKVSKSS